ncbi:hypothetical protein EIP86_010364 [Pleurotus ostreatoroseus]|nr:hypothetical protein EIP86_010364 [Pleurotus ostreatoroseus]
MRPIAFARVAYVFEDSSLPRVIDTDYNARGTHKHELERISALQKRMSAEVAVVYPTHPHKHTMETFAGLISLEEARRRPEIVYHSIRHLATPKKTAPTPNAALIPVITIAPATPTRRTRAARPVHTPPRPILKMPPLRMAAQPRRPVICTATPVASVTAATYLPLSVAAARQDIKYRAEGFEMKAQKPHKRPVRSNMF